MHRHNIENKTHACRDLRHIGRVMVRETGTHIEEGPSKERDTERVASRDRDRLCTERHTENVNTRRHTHTHTEIEEYYTNTDRNRDKVSYLSSIA
jgi:hypothetical protein